MRCEWKKVKISDVCKICYGKDHKQLLDGNVPAYGSGGIIRRVNKSIHEKKSVLIPRKGSLDNLFFVDPPFWTVDTLFWTDIDENKINPAFFFYQLKTLDLASKNVGTAVPSLTTSVLNDIEINLPSMDIQKQIAAILSALDEKIAINRAINENLERQAQAFFQGLFVDNADPEWAIGTINDLGAVVGGSTPSKAKPEYYTETGIAWITPKDLSVNKSKFISHGENDITELGLKNSSATIMPEGTVLFSSRAPIGYIAVAAGEVATNQGFKSIVPKPEIGTAFVYYFLKHNLPIIEGMASGSTFKEVSGSTMKGVPAVIPDTDTIARFNDFCSPIFAQQRILEEQNHSLAALRDNLLPKLMSGEVDVSDIQL